MANQMSTNPLSTAASTIRQVQHVMGSTAGNISHAETASYKGVRADFSNTVSGTALATLRQDVEAQGELRASNELSLALDGKGMFIGKDPDGNNVYFRRGISNGLDRNFTYKNDEGITFQGWRIVNGQPVGQDNTTPITGDIKNNLENLQDIDLRNFVNFAEPSSRISLSNRLNREAATDEEVSQNIRIFDPVGGAHTVTLNWKAIDAPTNMDGGDTPGNYKWFTLEITSDSGTVLQQKTGDPNYSTDLPMVAFDGNSVHNYYYDVSGIATTLENGMPNFTLNYTDQTLGTQDINLQLQKNGNKSTLTAFNSAAVLSADTDGLPLSQLRSITIDSEGILSVRYPSGDVPAYKIPVANFTAFNELEVRGGYYVHTREAGDLTINEAGEGGTGSINAGFSEGSTARTIDSMISAMPLTEMHGGAAYVITTTKELNEKTLRAM